MENLLPGHDETKRKELVKKVFKRLEISQSYHEPKRAVWEKCYKLYRGKADDEGQTSEPDIKIGFIFGIVEKIVSKLTSPFSGKLPVTIKPKKANQAKQAENFYTMCKDFHNSPRRVIEYTNSTRERAITGSSWETEDWDNVYVDGVRWSVNKINKAVFNFPKPVF